MAELTDQTLRNINQRLNEMNKTLDLSQTSVQQLGKALKEDLSPEQVNAFVNALNKVDSGKANKVRLMMELVDDKGKVWNENTVKERIKELSNAMDAVQKGTKVKIGGVEYTNVERLTASLNNYREMLKVLKMDSASAFQYVQNLVNKAAGGKKEYSPASIQKSENEREVRNLGKRVVEIKSLNNEQIKNNELLARRNELERKISEMEKAGKKRGLSELKKQWQEVNTATQEYLAKLAALDKAGERALKGFRQAGLISSADRSRIDEERLQIDLLRQRMQAEQQLQRFLQQKANASFAGKTVSPRVEDSISRLQERISTIDKQRMSDYTGFTQASLQRIEGMWQNHETTLTNIKTQGEQARQRIESRQSEQKQAEAQRQIVDALKQQLAIQSQIDKLKQAPQQTQAVQQQIQNLTQQYNQLGSSIRAIANGNQDIINQAQAQVSAQKQNQQNIKATANALNDAKNQEKAYNDGIKQMQKDEDTARKNIISLMQQQLSIQSQLNRLQNAPATQAVLGQVQNLTSQYQLLGQQIKNIANGNQKLVQSAQQYVAAQAQAQQNAQQTTNAINAARQQAQQQAQLARQQAQQQAQAARQRAAIERKADSESIANQRRQIQIKSQLSAIDKARNSIRDTTSKNAKAQIETENAEYKKLSTELTRLIARQKELNTIAQGSATRAKSRLQTYEIQANEAALRKYEEAWRRINNTQNKNKYTIQEMLPIVQRLGSALGIAFSVQGLAQFGKKLVETRGKFEMQFVAMKQIIGDVDEATKIWNQTMQQALQSPFTAMQLTDYTKKLAAYRIETDKLFDTTKRLADVSAGLGVDMGRLILAYGQVKTANYLRASEVRQFTEAGVNIYGELAKYFTEIEGRAVGTAEVVNRVSKRMVLFTDIEKIFQRMTEEGGAFFNMQEVQADTVRGQIMKLHDAYDQMLNSIGQAKDGTIRGFVDSLNNMVRNWQNVAFVLKTNVNWLTIIGGALLLLSRNYLKNATTQTLWFGKSILGTSKALLKNTADVHLLSTALGDYTFKQRAAIVATRTFQGALGALGKIFRTIAPFLAFELLVVGIERLTRANRELNRMKKELKDVASSNTDQMREEINGYGTLIEKLKKTTDGTYARKEVLDEISQKYGKYLDFIITETTSVEDLAGAYDKVVGSIRNYTAEKIREEQRQRVEKSMYDEYQELVGSLTGKRISDTAGNQIKITKTQAQNVAKLVQQSLEKYGAANIEKILERYFGNQFNFSTGGANTGTITDISSYIKEWKDLKSELDDIRDEIEKETPVFQSDKEYNDYKKRVEEANAALAEQAERNEEINNLIKKNNKEQWQAEDALNKQRIANTEAELRIRKEYGLITQKEYDDELARLHGQLDSYEKDYNLRLEKALQSASSFGNLWRILDKDARDIYNYVESTEDRLQQGTEQRNKQLVENYKGLKESLKEYNAALIAAQKTGANDESLKQIQKNIDWTTLMMKAIELAAKLRGLDLSGKKDKSGVNYDSISSLISLLKEMNSEYEKLSKSAYGYAKSNEKIVESFSPAFKEIFGFAGIDISQVDTTSKQATADAMKLVIDTLDNKNLWGRFGKDGGKKARKEFVKAWGQMAVEADLEVAVRIRDDFGRQIEKMFSDYELSLNFESMGIPEDLAKDLFGIDTSSLDEISSYLQRFATEHAEDWNEDINKIYADALNKISDKEQEQYKKDVSDLFKRVKSSAAEMKVVIEQACEDINFAQNLFDPNYVDQATKDIKAKIKQNLEEINRLTPSEGKAEGVAAQQIARLEAENKILENRVMRLTQMYGNISAEQYTDLVRSTIEWENERAQKISMEQLKKMPEYLEAMGRTAGWSNVKLREMLDYLKNLIAVSGSDMSLEDYKTVVNQIDKIQEQIKSNDYPFGREGFAKVAQMLEEQTEADEQMKQLEKERNRLQEKSKRLNEELVGLQERLNALKAGNHEENKDKIREVEDQIEENLRNQNQNANQQRKVAAGIQTITKGNMQTMVIIDAIIHAVNDTVQDLYKSLEKIEVILQDYSIDTEHGSWAEWTKGMETFAKASQDATNGWEAFKKGDVAGIMLEVVNGIVDIWHGINEIVNQKQVDTIYFNEEKIDDLKRAYERLEKQINKTWDSLSYMETYNEQIDNIKQQIDALNAQIAAEEDKKNPDEDKIRDWKNSLIDAEDELDELAQKQKEVFGGIGEEGYLDAAQGFVDAWKQAFLDTGDGLQGLQDHFDEFLQDWFTKQATMLIARKYLDSIFSQIDAAVRENGNGGVEVMWDEIQKMMDTASEQFPEFSAKLEEFFNRFGGFGEGSLSGLAAGIQGMTEEQANILEAYWNSVRMYAANIDMNVSRIAEMLGVGGPNSNPMLTHLQTIANNTAFIPQIYNLLNGSVKNMGNGRGFVSYQL